MTAVTRLSIGGFNEFRPRATSLDTIKLLEFCVHTNVTVEKYIHLKRTGEVNRTVDHVTRACVRTNKNRRFHVGGSLRRNRGLDGGRRARWDYANHSKLAQTEYNFPDKLDKPAVHPKKDKDKRKKERLLKIILI